MVKPVPISEPRSPARLKAHYLIEKALAGRLRDAAARERRRLYPALYDELYRQVPDHPQLTRKKNPLAQRAAVARQMHLLAPFLDRGATFMEIGAGDCSLSFTVAARVRRVYAVDVSETIAQATARPGNFELVISDGVTLPVPEASVTIAYSNQLMEHLHPEDALAQLGNIHRALAPGGTYICVTPNRLTGPHDVSAYFDDVSTGFHLKEYTYGELGDILRRTGFEHLRAVVGVKGRYFGTPLWLARLLESGLAGLPDAWRGRLSRWRPLEVLLGIQMIARKAGQSPGQSPGDGAL